MKFDGCRFYAKYYIEPDFKGGKQKDFAVWHNNCLEKIR